MNKLISVVGPTASGKTALGIYLANKFNGEIVSADSRQVYKYMDIGTAKDLKEYGEIKYHCISVVDPKTEYNLSKYLKMAHKAIFDVAKRNKIPFLVGGTGLYINAVTENYDLVGEAADEELRKQLNKKTKNELQELAIHIYEKYQLKDVLNHSDFNNPYRLIRFIEKNNKEFVGNKKREQLYDNLIIGLNVDKDKLGDKILKRLDIRLEGQEMIREVWNLHFNHKVSWTKILSFGLEYEGIAEFLIGIKNKIKNDDELNAEFLKKNFSYEYENMRKWIHIASMQFIKKQMTWFKKNENIKWIDVGDSLYYDAENLVKGFLGK